LKLGGELVIRNYISLLTLNISLEITDVVSLDRGWFINL
jgi:hypothetical protein